MKLASRLLEQLNSGPLSLESPIIEKGHSKQVLSLGEALVGGETIVSAPLFVAGLNESEAQIGSAVVAAQVRLPACCSKAPVF
jgi:hypothetical protein